MQIYSNTPSDFDFKLSRSITCHFSATRSHSLPSRQPASTTARQTGICQEMQYAEERHPVKSLNAGLFRLLGLWCLLYRKPSRCLQSSDGPFSFLSLPYFSAFRLIQEQRAVSRPAELCQASQGICGHCVPSYSRPLWRGRGSSGARLCNCTPGPSPWSYTPYPGMRLHPRTPVICQVLEEGTSLSLVALHVCSFRPCWRRKASLSLAPDPLLASRHLTR